MKTQLDLALELIEAMAIKPEKTTEKDLQLMYSLVKEAKDIYETDENHDYDEVAQESEEEWEELPEFNE